jgi:tetratricopeptide (TPR) repeat protein
MTDPLAPEPPLEVLMLGPEPLGSHPAPSAAVPSLRAAAPMAPVVPALRAERWLFVVHLLILIAFAGLVVYFVSLVWRDGDRKPGAEAAPVMLPAALASASAPAPVDAPAPAVPAAAPIVEKPVKAPEKKEPIEPAVAPVSGAEEPIPAASRPEPAPPPPALTASSSAKAAEDKPVIAKPSEEKPSLAKAPEPTPAAPAPAAPPVVVAAAVLPPVLPAAPTATAAVTATPPAPPAPAVSAPAAETRPPGSAPEDAEEAQVPLEVRISPEAVAGRKCLEEAAALEATNPALAAERYRKALAALPGRTDLWKTIADLELSSGSGEEACRSYREFLKYHPGRVDALQNLAVLHFRAGRTEEARLTLEAAIKLAPSADLYYDLGNVLLKSGEVDRAILAYRRALEYAPKHPETRFNLALALERSGKRPEAVATLAQMGSVAPDVVRERARMEAMIGGLEADRAMDLARGSSDTELIVSVASGFRRAGELEKSLALLDRAVDLDPHQATLRLDRGVVRQAMGRTSEAAADYEEAAKLDPSLADARFNLGVLAEEKGQYVSALEQYRAALKIDPALAGAHNNIGTLYLKVGQPAKAVECFRRCRDLDGSFWAARLNLALGLVALDSRGPAIDELKLYLKEVPKDRQDPEAARVLGELERSRVVPIGTRP